GAVHGRIVVNAAGAWADHVAALAGLAPLGIVPHRRTAVIVSAPTDMPTTGWPMVEAIGETWYLKPDAGRLLCSPADETPCDPGDVQAEELDVAICVDRIEQAFTFPVRRIESRWAGLRCFARDRTPVVGEDPRAPGFFWLAGQGGYGIQIAPALAATAAALITGDEPSLSLRGAVLDTSQLRPDRLLPAT
ncbi:MAG: FAD-binding oxidoreductase, partial [Geminicoccaceae bacterium]